MHMNCEVIRDLLPLYHDGVCSSESKALVEQHLKNCLSCQKELETMDAEFTPAHIEGKEVNSFKAASIAWKKSKKKSFIKGTAITVAICALLFAGFYGLTQWKCFSVPANSIEVTNLSQLSDGSIIFNLTLNSNQKSSYVKYTTTEDGEFYLTPKRSVIEQSGTIGMHGYYVIYPAGFKTSEPEHPGIFLPENVTKIYVGPVGEGTLVWEEGMELPAVSDTVEAMFAAN